MVTSQTRESSRRDVFGNSFAPGLPYARGRLLSTTEDDYAKLQKARYVIRKRVQEQGKSSIYNFSGLQRSLSLDGIDPWMLDDEVAPAMYGEEVTELGLAHMGGASGRDDVMVFNRLTAALFAVHLAMVEKGQSVIGFSASYSHPVISRSADRCGATFADATSLRRLEELCDEPPAPALVVITRLAVTYEILPEEEITAAVEIAHDRGIPVLLDDAGGARVGPAVFGQQRALELGVDAAATGLDKYGTQGPRLGLLAGRRDIVAAARARGFELGLEARPMLYPAVVDSLRSYSPERVVERVRATSAVGDALRARLGDRVVVGEVSVQVQAESLLTELLDRAGATDAPLVPYEATAALAMRLLRDHGILSVHFAGLPPGTAALLLKFLDPHELDRYGGPEALSDTIDDEITELARGLDDVSTVAGLLFEV